MRKKPKYNSILFDLDGTLIDSFKGIELGIEYALNEMNHPQISSNTINKMIGVPLNVSLEKFVFNNNQELVLKAIQLFREYYSRKGIFEASPYQGIHELICDLSKIYTLYIITAKPTPLAIKVLSHFNLSDSFQQICGKSDNDLSFSKDVLINNLCLKSSALIIGDKKQDILAGKLAGIDTAGVLYGYGSKEEIVNSNPKYILNQVKDIRNLLL